MPERGVLWLPTQPDWHTDPSLELPINPYGGGGGGIIWHGQNSLLFGIRWIKRAQSSMFL